MSSKQYIRALQGVLRVWKRAYQDGDGLDHGSHCYYGSSQLSVLSGIRNVHKLYMALPSLI